EPTARSVKPMARRETLTKSDEGTGISDELDTAQLRHWHFIAWAVSLLNDSNFRGPSGLIEQFCQRIAENGSPQTRTAADLSNLERGGFVLAIANKLKFVTCERYPVRNQTFTIFLYIAASAAISLSIPSVSYAA